MRLYGVSYSHKDHQCGRASDECADTMNLTYTSNGDHYEHRHPQQDSRLGD